MIHSEESNVRVSGDFDDVTLDLAFIITAIVSILKKLGMPEDAYKQILREMVNEIENRKKEGKVREISLIDILGGDKDE